VEVGMEVDLLARIRIDRDRRMRRAGEESR